MTTPGSGPPRWAHWLLTWLHPAETLEEVEGDLDELYAYWNQRAGSTQATLRYLLNVVSVLPPFVRRRQSQLTDQQPSSYHPAMIRSHIKIGLRNLWNHKASSLINLFGLTVGLSACLLIGLYIQHELSFDTFQVKGDRIARVIMEYRFNDSQESNQGNFTSTKVAPVFARTFPEVEAAVRMTDQDMPVRYGDKLATEPHFLFADSSFFRLFNASFLQGNPQQALNGPNKVVLTQATAQKYFGSENPLGKIMLMGSDSTAYQVTGVVDEYPTNSQIQFDFLASFSSLGVNQEETYFDANYTTYLLLKSPQALPTLAGKVTRFMQQEMAGSGAFITFHLEPFLAIHLQSEYGGFVPNTNLSYLYLLLGVAGLILTIVSFTYINLSTARSVERAKEVGVRKVVGAQKAQLFWQFISESGLLCFMALLLSFLLALLALPAFTTLTQVALPAQTLFSPSFIGTALLITGLLSLLAGSYPALVLVGFQPIRILKGLLKHSSTGRQVQQSLVVLQFAISIGLLVATVVIQQQLAFIQHKKLGYDRAHVLVLPLNRKMLPQLAVIKQELKTSPDILSVARSRNTPVRIVGGYNMRSALMPDHEQLAVTANPMDEEFIQTVGLQLVAGSNFSRQDVLDVDKKEQAAKRYHFILNESAAKQLGWTPEQAIGKRMFLDNSRPGLVKGVVKDFHFESLQTAIKPLVLFPELRDGKLLVKLSGRHLAQTLSFIETKWKQVVPYTPFEYRFLDDDFAQLYRSEQQLTTVMDLFAGLALVLTCLGLLGLSAYVVAQRTKEIGVRKVLGASVASIVTLLGRDFLKLVLLAILMASPLAYYGLSRWLVNYAYRIQLEWWVFLGASLVVTAIALLTVSLQSLRAAFMNPVKSLRSE